MHTTRGSLFSRATPTIGRVLAAVGCALLSGSVLASELWVVQQGAFEVDVVDPSLLSVLASIDILDPDGNSVSDTPYDLCMSTIPGSAEYAFVAQGPLVTVLSVPTRSVVQTVNVASLLGIPGASVRACAASVPRRFTSVGGGSAFETRLYVGVLSPSGSAHYAILDQPTLTTTGGSPLVEGGLLSAGATPVDVQVLTAPEGDRHVRAWFTLTRTGGALGDSVESIRLDTPATLGLPSIVGPAVVATLPLGATLPTSLRSSAPEDRELPARANGPLGSLVNLDTGGDCTPGGDLSAVSISGVGPNSYNVLATDRSANTLLLVDPVGCGTTSVAVEAGPLAVIPLARYEWQGAYVLNHAADSLTFVRDDGTTTRLGFDPGDGPWNGQITGPPKCAVDELRFSRVPDTAEGPDDLRISWEPCPGVEEYFVWCTCLDEHPNCSCRCDCDDNPPAGCSCPAEPVNNGGGGINMIQNWPPPDEFSSNPWKKLDSTVIPEFIDPDQWEGQNQQAYEVTTIDEAPLPP